MDNDYQLGNFSFASIANNTTMVAAGRDCKFPLIQGTLFISINLFLAVFGTFGNFMIIFAILDTPQLRQKVSNFLLLSLAVADLLVTMVAQPLLVTSVSLRTFAHRCNREVDWVFVVVASLAGWSSVFHLAAISIDRAISTAKPHQHHEIMKKWLKKMLCICWGIAAVFSCLIIPFPQVNIAIVVIFLFNFAIMICAYVIILHSIKFPNIAPNAASTSSTPRNKAMEKRVSGTIAIVILLFAVCFFPLIVNLITDYNKAEIEVKYWWIRIFYLSNSSMNFIVYSLRIRHFRVAYLRIINRNLQRLRSAARKCCCT